MKQKIQKLFKISFLAIFLAGEFFGFGAVQKVYAFCAYEIEEFAVKKPGTWEYINSATPGDTIAVVSTLKKTGSSSECGSAGTALVTDQIEFNGRNGWTSLASERDTNISYNAGTGQYIYTLNLGTFDRARLAKTNELELRLSVCKMTTTYTGGPAPGGVPVCGQLAQSSPYVVNISGAGGSTGSVAMTLNFIPIQSSYQNGTQIQICANLNQTQVRNLDSSINRINYETYVNGKKVDSYGRDRSWFLSYVPCQEVIVNDKNSFKNGPNNIIKAELWQSNSSIKISEGTATLDATGLSSSGGGGGGGGVSGGEVYACKAGDGKYACSKSNNPNLDDVTATGGDCGNGPGTDFYIVQIDPSMCGCTQEDYDAKKCKDGQTVTPGGGGGKPDTKIDEHIFNPLKYDSLTDTLLSIAQGFLGIVAIWGVAFIIIGGFKLVMAQGNEEAYTSAKKTITWAILGVVVAALSFAIMAIVQNLLGVNIQKRPGTPNPIIRNTQPK